MELYEYEREHRDLLRRLAPECMVLLKSDGTFPLEAPCKVALYGSGARETICYCPLQASIESKPDCL